MLLHAPVGVVDAAVQRQLRRARVQLVDRHALEERNGIVIDLAPEGGVELAKEAGRVVVPAPPEILRERGQAMMRRRDVLSDRACLADDRRHLRARHHQHPHVVGAEGARLDRLHDQHALQQPAIEDRHAEE